MLLDSSQSTQACAKAKIEQKRTAVQGLPSEEHFTLHGTAQLQIANLLCVEQLPVREGFACPVLWSYILYDKLPAVQIRAVDSFEDTGREIVSSFLGSFGGSPSVTSSGLELFSRCLMCPLYSIQLRGSGRAPDEWRAPCNPWRWSGLLKS